MAKKEGNRPKITLACTECKQRNYVTVKNRQNDRDRIELKKYCRFDRRHTLHRETRKTTATDLEMFRKLLDEVQAGDNVGVLLRGIDKDEVSRGQVLAKPGSVTPHTDFVSQVYVLSKEEGGRHTPFFNGYRPQFYFRTTDVTGSANLPEGVEMVMPGDNVEMTVNLIAPIAMEEGLRFAIREGGRTVGAVRVTKIIK